MLTTITLPNGTTLETTADAASLAAILGAATAVPAVGVPTAQPTAQEPTKSAPRRRRKTSKAAGSKPKASGKGLLAEVRKLTAEGRFDEALGLCPTTWAQEVDAIRRKAAAAQEPKAAQEAPKEPAQEATPKADKSKGGTRSSNGHKLDCRCGVCQKVYGRKAAIQEKAAPASLVHDKKATVTPKRTTPKASAEAQDAKVRVAASLRDVLLDLGVDSKALLQDIRRANRSQDGDLKVATWCEAMDVVAKLDVEADGHSGAVRREILSLSGKIATLADLLNEKANA